MMYTRVKNIIPDVLLETGDPKTNKKGSLEKLPELEQLWNTDTETEQLIIEIYTMVEGNSNPLPNYL